MFKLHFCRLCAAPFRVCVHKDDLGSYFVLPYFEFVRELERVRTEKHRIHFCHREGERLIVVERCCMHLMSRRVAGAGVYK